MSSIKMTAVLVSAACSVLALTGCKMCNDPIWDDPSCIEPSHSFEKNVDPSVISYTAPTIAPCTDVFRPEFRVGDKRLTVTGSGMSLEEATADAMTKFLDSAKCDYVVAVTRIVSMKTHPTFRFFATTNYTVTISGLPVYLDKLVKEEPKKIGGPLPPPPVPQCKCMSKDELTKLIEGLIEKKMPPASPFGLVKLSDINIEIKAKGETPDPAALTFPAPPAPAEKK